MPVVRHGSIGWCEFGPCSTAPWTDMLAVRQGSIGWCEFGPM